MAYRAMHHKILNCTVCSFNTIYCAIATFWRENSGSQSHYPNKMDATRPTDEQESISDALNRTYQLVAEGQRQLSRLCGAPDGVMHRHWALQRRMALILGQGQTTVPHHYQFLNQFEICSRPSGPAPVQLEGRCSFCVFQNQLLQVIERGRRIFCNDLSKIH